MDLFDQNLFTSFNINWELNVEFETLTDPLNHGIGHFNNEKKTTTVFNGIFKHIAGIEFETNTVTSLVQFPAILKVNRSVDDQQTCKK